MLCIYVSTLDGNRLKILDSRKALRIRKITEANEILFHCYFMGGSVYKP